MTRAAVILLVMVLFSAIYQVRVQYESRRLVAEIEQQRQAARRLAEQRSSLEVEKRAQATSLRVEMLARDKLAMRSITPAITEYVNLSAVRRLEARP